MGLKYLDQLNAFQVRLFKNKRLQRLCLHPFRVTSKTVKVSPGHWNFTIHLKLHPTLMSWSFCHSLSWNVIIVVSHFVIKCHNRCGTICQKIMTIRSKLLGQTHTSLLLIVMWLSVNLKCYLSIIDNLHSYFSKELFFKKEVRHGSQILFCLSL